MAEATLWIVVLLALFIATAGSRFGHMSLISLFTYAQAVMALGTLPLLDPTLEADQMHALLIVMTFGALVFTAFVSTFLNSKSRRANYAATVDYTHPKFVWVLIWISIGVSALYYAAVGYLAFFEALKSLMEGSEADIAGLRLESYAGSRYLYPGYVNQFKNALLPALVIVVVIASFHARKSGRWLSALFFGGITIVFLLGTGQRGAFVTAAVLAVVTLYFVSPDKAPRYTLRFALVAIPLFFIATFATGRASSDLLAAENPLAVVGVMFDQLAFRLLGSNQLTSTVGFHYVYTQEIPFASEWIKGFVGLLPGQEGSDLSNRIFAMLYGSTRGTAPLSVWGAAYHNLGFVGALIFAVILAIIFCAISARANMKTNVNLVQLAGIAGVTATLGTWIADGPVSFLNKGLVVYVLLWWWGNRIEKRKMAAHSRF